MYEVSQDTYAEQRLAMVAQQLRARGIHDDAVLNAMACVPRHEFVPAAERAEAYGDHALPIGAGQTISQPFVVAAMLEAVALQAAYTVLEIGTGSGYESALLSQLVRTVYTIERIGALAQRSREVLQGLHYSNITVIEGDGSQGWPEAAPFDAIVVSAAAPAIPAPLFDQLRDGGRMVVPVGEGFAQQLQLVRKIGGQAVTSFLEAVRFVPLIGRNGFREAR